VTRFPDAAAAGDGAATAHTRTAAITAATRAG
jgi:hypothetical protein